MSPVNIEPPFCFKTTPITAARYKTANETEIKLPKDRITWAISLMISVINNIIVIALNFFFHFPFWITNPNSAYLNIFMINCLREISLNSALTKGTLLV